MMQADTNIAMVDGEGLAIKVGELTRQVLKAAIRHTGDSIALHHEEFSGIQTIPFLQNPEVFGEDVIERLAGHDLVAFGALGDETLKDPEVRERYQFQEGVSPVDLAGRLIMGAMRSSSGNAGVRTGLSFEGLEQHLNNGPFSIDLVQIHDRDVSEKRGMGRIDGPSIQVFESSRYQANR